MVPERLSRRHAAAHAARGGDRVPARRGAERHQPLRRGQDRLDARRRSHLRHPRLRDVPDPVAPRRARHDHPREQLHAVDRDGGGLHDDAAHLGDRGLHVGDQRRAAVVADHVLQRRALLDGRAGGVSDEAPLHQRRAAALSRGPRLRRRARRAVRIGGRSGRDVQGPRARRGSRDRGHDRRALRREHHADGATEVARSRERLASAAVARRLVLRAGGEGAGAVAAARGRGPAAARALPVARSRDDRRRRLDGHPHRIEPARRRDRQLRDHRADHDHRGSRSFRAPGRSRKAPRSSDARTSSTPGRSGGASR